MKRSILEQLTFRFNFHFSHNGHQIDATGNSVTGNEAVSVNGVQVSQRRVIAKNSEHHIQVDGDDYSVRFIVTGYFLCEVTCELWQQDELIASQHMRTIEGTSDLIKMVALLFGVGVLAGFLAAKAALMVLG